MPFRTHFWLATLATLLALPSCGDNTTYLMVLVHVPDPLRPTSLRVVQYGAGTTRKVTDHEKTLRPTGDGGVDYKVGVPTASIGLTLIVQAMSDSQVLAEGTMQVPDTIAVTSTLLLQPCEKQLSKTDEFESCQPEVPPSGPPDPTEDGSAANRDASDGRPGDSQVACVPGDPMAPRPTVPSVPMPSPACQEYCAVMAQNCPDIYGTLAQCLYVCDRLRWAAMGDPGQDTVACRTSHAQQPADPGIRYVLCMAAGPALGQACGDPCAVYCRTGAHFCPGSFPGEAECTAGCRRVQVRWMEAVKQRPDSAATDDFSSVMGCKAERLHKAIFNPTYCSEAAPHTKCGGCTHPLSEP